MVIITTAIRNLLRTSHGHSKRRRGNPSLLPSMGPVVRRFLSTTSFSARKKTLLLLLLFCLIGMPLPEIITQVLLLLLHLLVQARMLLHHRCLVIMDRRTSMPPPCVDTRKKHHPRPSTTNAISNIRKTSRQHLSAYTSSSMMSVAVFLFLGSELL